MDERRTREERICPVHGEMMEVRNGRLYCRRCDGWGRHGHVVIAACLNPECGRVLLDVGHCISRYPAIVLGWRYTEEDLRDGKPHVLHVSAVWGDHTVHPDTDVMNGKVLDLFCPFCGAEFLKKSYCIECRAKMAEIPALYMDDGRDGSVEICSRWRCPQHRKVRRGEFTAAAGLQFMCGGGHNMNIAAMRAVAAERGGFEK